MEAGAAPPDAFGPFRVLHQVGAGALGPVFRAFDPERDRFVAVKLFRLDLPPDRMHQLVAQLEGLVTADLHHPVIAAPIATGTDGIVAYLAQDFVAADSLDVVMRDHGPAPPADALRVAAQLASALDFAAVVDVHHGALHPRDVLLTQDDTRLTGLGIARVVEQIGVTPPIRRPYSAPERIAGGEWDRRVDIFGLAALIHEMLWGRRVVGVGDEAAQSLTELPGADLRELRRVFARALAEAPGDRFETALDFAAALKAVFPAVAIASSALSAVVTTLEQRSLYEIDDDAPPRPTDQLTADDLQFIHHDSQLPVDAVVPIDAGGLVGDDGGQRPTTNDQRPSFDDFELRAAELDRYEDVEGRPAIPEDVPSDLAPETLGSIDTENASLSRAGSPLFGADPSDVIAAGSSRVWPIAAALIVGLACGFGGGLFVGGRQRPAPPVAVALAPAPPSAAITPTPQAREYTEGPVARPLSQVPAKPPPIAPEKTPGPQASLKPDIAANVAGRLLVRSTPAGATVFVDGRARGRTPATIRDLARGTHRVRIVRDGYVSENRRIVITASRPAESMIVALERARPTSAGSVARLPAPRTPGTVGTFTGELHVDSRPAGAKVFLDGKLVGTTPMAMPQVAAGEHVLRLEQDTYRRWSSLIRVVTGERNRVTASLER